jgi:ribosome biogenesis GTPase A
LNVVLGKIREIKVGVSDCTGTVLLVGTPNVGKSAIVNGMHQIGRIGAAGDASYFLPFVFVIVF